MPIGYARSLTSHRASDRSVRHLGCALAFVAGAANAGAFLSVGLYTLHMTGIVSSLAEDLALGEWALPLAGMLITLSVVPVIDDLREPAQPGDRGQ